MRKQPPVNPERSTWKFAKLNIGERVIFMSSRGGRETSRHPYSVTKVTDRRFQISLSDNTWFRRDDGKTVSGLFHNSMFESHRAVHASVGELAAFDKHQTDMAEAQTRVQAERDAHEATEEHRIATRIHMVGHEVWEKYPIDVLRQIHSLIMRYDPKSLGELSDQHERAIESHDRAHIARLEGAQR